MPVNYSKTAIRITADIKDLVDGIELAYLDDLGRFSWAGEFAQVNADAQTRTTPVNRRWRLEFNGLNNRRKASALNQFEIGATFAVDYAVGKIGPAERMSQIAVADGMALFDRFNVAQRWLPASAVVLGVSAATGTIIPIPGNTPDTVAALQHRIPLTIHVTATA